MPIYKGNNIFQQVDLSLLKYFFAIATFRGFSNAARATGISQPALSLGLKKLEKSLGAELIDRSQRPFELTKAGLSLLTFCERLEGQVENVVRSLGTEGLSFQKRFRVGTALSIGFAPINELCSHFSKEQDAPELELLAKNTYQLLEDVSAGILDGAFVPDDVYDSRLTATPYIRDRIVFVVGQKPRAAFQQNWKQSISTLPLITYPHETPMRTLTDKLCVSNKLQFKTTYAVNSIEALKLLVKANRGAAFVLRHLIEDEITNKEIFEIRLPIRLPKSGIAFVQRHSDRASSGAKVLSNFVQRRSFTK